MICGIIPYRLLFTYISTWGSSTSSLKMKIIKVRLCNLTIIKMFLYIIIFMYKMQKNFSTPYYIVAYTTYHFCP